MVKFQIIPTCSVDKIDFFSRRDLVRAVFGDNYTNSLEPSADPVDVKNAMDIVEEKIKEVYKELGKEPDEFMWPDLSQYDSDYDSYGSHEIEYDENHRFISFTVVPGKGASFVIEGKEYSGCKTETYLSLATDFIWDDVNTGYTSRSKQINLYCPCGKNTVESIIFGSSGYFDE